MPRNYRLGSGNFQSCRRHVKLPGVPQRRHRARQTRAAPDHGSRLRHLPQYIELGSLDSCAQAASAASEATGRG
jgi:hypothetical protein